MLPALNIGITGIMPVHSTGITVTMPVRSTGTTAIVPVQIGEKIVAIGGPVTGFAKCFHGFALHGFGYQTLFA